jgi:transposase-like protein
VGRAGERDTAAKLAALALQVLQLAAQPCPGCEKPGPHEENGQEGRERAFLCTDCGEQWEA